MEKIVIETTMKKLPETCSKCKFKAKTEDMDICTAITPFVKLEKTYVKERYNWTFVIPETCPLVAYEVEE